MSVSLSNGVALSWLRRFARNELSGKRRYGGSVAQKQADGFSFAVFAVQIRRVRFRVFRSLFSQTFRKMSQPTGHLGNFCFGSFVLDIEEHTLPSIQPFGAILTILGVLV
jgi:hypothetical protein